MSPDLRLECAYFEPRTRIRLEIVVEALLTEDVKICILLDSEKSVTLLQNLLTI